MEHDLAPLSPVEPWHARLAESDVEAAWSLFIDRYRRVILATIRRLIPGDDAMEAFHHVCAALSKDRLARLRRYREDAPRQARFPTWLVTVVHNLVIDWQRQRDGRRRVRVPAGLTSLQERIFTCVFVEHRSHAETYEILCASGDREVTLSRFLHALAETYRVVERERPRGAMHYFAAPPPPPAVDADAERLVAAAELSGRLSAAMAMLAEDERAALQLYVVEGMPAADVARTVGWPDAKAVYNRAYRTLKRLRAALEREGIRRRDI